MFFDKFLILIDFIKFWRVGGLLSSTPNLFRLQRVDAVLVVDLSSDEGWVEYAGELQGGLSSEEVAVVPVEDVEGTGGDLVDPAAV